MSRQNQRPSCAQTAARLLETLTVTKTDAAVKPAAKAGTADAAKKANGHRFREVMKAKGYTAQKLAEAINARGNIEVDAKKLQNLQSIGYESIDSFNDPLNILEPAAVLGVPVWELFAGEARAQLHQILSASEEPVITMCRDALEGPRREFLLEAIQMAHTAKLMATGRPPSY